MSQRVEKCYGGAALAPPASSRKRTKQDGVSPNKKKTREQQDRTLQRSKMEMFIDANLSANMDSQDHDLKSQASRSKKKGGGGKGVDLNNLPPEEASKRHRIRVAARERQRKHRAGIKAKRMAELGMAIVNAGGGIEQTAIGYTINEDGQYEAVLADPGDHQIFHAPFSIPHPHATPGQTFASAILHALCWNPHLKHYLLHSLNSADEDLVAFGPIIAAVFDHWDQGRSSHYAAQDSLAFPSSHLPPVSAPDSRVSAAFDFRNRFQRPLGVPLLSNTRHKDESCSPSEDSHQANSDSDAERGRSKPQLQGTSR